MSSTVQTDETLPAGTEGMNKPVASAGGGEGGGECGSENSHAGIRESGGEGSSGAGGDADGGAAVGADPLLLLDHAVVKDRLTLLHAEVDGILSDLSARTGTDIAGIPGEMERRLAGQFTAHKAGLVNSRQQNMFDEITRPLLAAARQKAAALQVQRIRSFQTDVVARQNAALVRRALSDENLLDDSLQTKYRDAILLNLETLHQALPPADSQDILDAASRDLYRAVLDRRLRCQPESAAAMLRSEAVRRALEPDEAAKFDRSAAEAVAVREREQTARDWAELPAEEAERRAKRHGAAGQEILADYRRFRADQDERTAMRHLLAVREAWAEVADNGYRFDAAGSASPALRSLVRDLLDAWLGNGGAVPEPDYARFLEYMTETERSRVWAELAKEDAAHAFIRSLGGVEGWAFALAARRMVATSTAEDKALISDLLSAREEYGRRRGTENTPEEKNTGDTSGQAAVSASADLNRFLSAVHRNRRIKLERLDRTELLTGEMAEIIRSCGENGVFYTEEKEISKTALAYAG